ncbi:hypothetical protein SAMN04488032_104186 [Pacificibacter marinus]|uniref:Uncharacterized protein n=1 Tax=Pacificibacter marinus TaxID=658057 RepID=A0A1Y5SHT5_9RHOB|nr:hypothetical protein SAMN04488032_104186 [Pacificibacter marinus]SLN41156.1 hypothetical protein PAM7971_01891 [Pacificibacter marinus]
MYERACLRCRFVRHLNARHSDRHNPRFTFYRKTCGGYAVGSGCVLWPLHIKTPAPGRRRRGCLLSNHEGGSGSETECGSVREEGDAAALAKVPQGGGEETKEGVGVEPEFFAVMSGRRRHHRLALDPSGRRRKDPNERGRLARISAVTSGRRRHHRLALSPSGRRRKDQRACGR